MDEVVVHIALGSNVGDRAATLLEAIKRIDDLPDVSVRRISRFLQSDPVGGPNGQGKYLNAAAEIATTLSPHALLSALQEIEHSLGRNRRTEQRWGPRTCDLDILLIEQTVLDSEDLTIPHPRLHGRLFVLRPLASIAPDAVHPVLGRTVLDLLADAEAAK